MLTRIPAENNIHMSGLFTSKLIGQYKQHPPAAIGQWIRWKVVSAKPWSALCCQRAWWRQTEQKIPLWHWCHTFTFQDFIVLPGVYVSIGVNTLLILLWCFRIHLQFGIVACYTVNHVVWDYTLHSSTNSDWSSLLTYLIYYYSNVTIMIYQ